ncbi:hypothetical protein R3P38DRAFT_3332768 [Favolaschia claudopus]|uniref:Integrase core domain-containing protein n=1 Tax=Favolaschia claudopus TaxID=2862362 RepID=A0AAV9ZKF6_9AGAR
MVTALDPACHDSTDPPDAAPLTVVHRVRTGRRGRPRVEIDPQFLSAALDLRGPTGIAPEIGVSARTVRRAALRAGLVQPGAPVFQSRTNSNGELEVVHTSTAPPVSVVSNEELDRLLSETLEVFPQFGRRMIRGHLKSQGYRIPRDRITASYLRVHGAPAIFGDRQISRKKYRVPGPMSLAHLDGQHGLIRYKIVIHCIIDGYSRFVLGIRVHNNNRGASVLRLLLDVIALHGCPSRMRGDHGVENIEVAAYMERVKGSGRGSFIWGRSVHNTRIERLWYNVTHGFGKKWKVFFLDLETNHGLNPTRPGHIWLLHHLFLASINRDALDRCEAWNSHQLTVRRQRERSPRDLFTFRMLREGPRGISSFLAAEDEEIEDINEYGIDWEANAEPELMAHLFENNPDERTNNTDPFASSSTPANLSEVLCEPPGCPFTPRQLQLLDLRLDASVDLFSRNMNVRRLVWVRALQIAQEIQQGSVQ